MIPFRSCIGEKLTEDSLLAVSQGTLRRITSLTNFEGCPYGRSTMPGPSVCDHGASLRRKGVRPFRLSAARCPSTTLPAIRCAEPQESTASAGINNGTSRHEGWTSPGEGPATYFGSLDRFSYSICPICCRQSRPQLIDGNLPTHFPIEQKLGHFAHSPHTILSILTAMMRCLNSLYTVTQSFPLQHDGAAHGRYETNFNSDVLAPFVAVLPPMQWHRNMHP